MSDKPIDLEKRRSLMKRFAAIEKEFRSLKGAIVSPEQLATLALGEAAKNEKHFKACVDAFAFATPWLLEQMALYGAWLQLTGHKPEPSAALAMVTKSTAFADNVFAAAVQARIAQLEDELRL